MSGTGRRRRPDGESSPESGGQWYVPPEAPSGQPPQQPEPPASSGAGRRRRGPSADEAPPADQPPAAPYQQAQYPRYAPPPGDNRAYYTPPAQRYGRPDVVPGQVVSGQVVPPQPSGPAGPDFSDLDIDFDEIVTGRPAAQAPPAAPVPPPTAPQAPAGPPPDRPPADYESGDFAFAEEPDADSGDVLDWKIFADSRADLRGERIRRFRARAIAVAVVVVLIAGGVGGYLYFNRSAGPVHTSMLVQVDDQNGNAVASMLLVTDGTDAAGGQGNALLVPSNLQYNDAGNGQVAFGGAEPSMAPGGADTLSTLLGVQVDGTWSVNEGALSILIDNLGGLSLDADATVTSGGKTLVTPGRQTLDGTAVTAYALTPAKGESQTEQLTRFKQVFAALLNALPSGASTINSLFANMNMLATDVNFPNSRVASVLATAKAEQQAGRLGFATLPVNGDGTLNATAAGPLVKDLFGGVLHETESGSGIARVLVEDGSGYTSLDTALLGSAQLKLVNGGYTYIDGGMLGGSAHAQTVVEVANSSGEAQGDQVAETLGLPTSAVQVVAGMPSLADVIVVLGKDWPGVTGPPTGATAHST